MGLGAKVDSKNVPVVKNPMLKSHNNKNVHQLMKHDSVRRAIDFA